jgi:hypothetical protein
METRSHTHEEERCSLMVLQRKCICAVLCVMALSVLLVGCSQEPVELTAFELDGRYGFKDAQGKVVIEPVWRSALAWYSRGSSMRIPEFDPVDGLALVRAEDNQLMYIDRTGKAQYKLPRYIAAVWPFSDGYARVALAQDEHGNRIYNTGYTPVFPGLIGDKADKEHLQDLEEEFVQDALTQRYGYIDRNRRLVIVPHYIRTGDFNEGLAPVSMNARYPQMTPGFDAYRLKQANSLIEKVNGRWGFINKQDELVIPMQYLSVGDFSCGRARVLTSTGWGFIDRTGKLVIPGQYMWVKDFEEHRGAKVYSDRESDMGYWYRYIDPDGKPTEFDGEWQEEDIF